MIRRLFILCLLGVGLLGSACDGSSDDSSTQSEQSEHNVLKEYVKTPLDKADSVAERADDRTDQINRALNED